MDVWHVGTLFGVPRIVSTVDPGSRSSLIGHITPDVKCAGARSAGNPHATCDVAGAGNQFTVRLVRHSHNGNGEQRIDRTYGAMAPVLDPTGATVVVHVFTSGSSVLLPRWGADNLSDNAHTAFAELLNNFVVQEFVAYDHSGFARSLRSCSPRTPSHGRPVLGALRHAGGVSVAPGYSR
jgi:hypothetical protein